MKVSEILKKGDTLLDAEINIEGVFVMKRGIGYFVESKDSRDSINEAIFIDYPDLEKYLELRVPGLAGGQYGYCDSAIIVGVLKKETLQEFEFSLINIKIFTIFKYGNPISVLSSLKHEM
ncbi:hypothetical protein [Undibacterium sp. TJN19]|uniref:hypothetical protein n=1 Tax=Undibacterium sp. TJN19 TaxID=3413055 RepID=UPI003BF11CAA